MPICSTSQQWTHYHVAGFSSLYLLTFCPALFFELSCSRCMAWRIVSIIMAAQYASFITAFLVHMSREAFLRCDKISFALSAPRSSSSAVGVFIKCTSQFAVQSSQLVHYPRFVACVVSHKLSHRSRRDSERSSKRKRHHAEHAEPAVAQRELVRAVSVSGARVKLEGGDEVVSPSRRVRKERAAAPVQASLCCLHCQLITTVLCCCMSCHSAPLPLCPVSQAVSVHKHVSLYHFVNLICHL